MTPLMCDSFAAMAGCPTPYADGLWFSGGFAYCRTHLVDRHRKAIADHGQPVTLITSASDATATVQQAAALPSNVVRWYSTNAEWGHRRLSIIPIGFVSGTGPDSRWAAMQKVLSEPLEQEPKRLLLCCFSAHTSPDRQGLAEMFPWATIAGGRSAADVPPEEYYRLLRRHRFVLSPPGAGPDCHRHWEAMACGAVPIVRRCQVMKQFHHLPWFFVDSWTEITERRIEEVEATIEDTEWCTSFEAWKPL